MKTIEITISNKIAQTTTENAFIVCGNSDYEILFKFDEEWDSEVVKTAVFVYGDYSIPVVFSGNICEVPVLYNTTQLRVGVFAGEIKTTTSAYIPCKRAITDEGGQIPDEPNEEVYNKIIGLVNDIAVDIPKLGATLSMEIDDNYVLSVFLKNMSGEILSQKSVDLPIESLVVSAIYNDEQKSIIFTLQNGETLSVPVGDLVKGFVKEEDYNTLKNTVETNSTNIVNLDRVKQQKYDDNLNTKSKEIVGAINEVKGLAEETRMIFGETEGTAYEGSKGKKNADDISKLNLKLDLIERNIFQSGLGSIVPLTEAFVSRETANGANILDPSPAIVEMIKGKTVKSENLFNINGNIALGKRVSTSTGGVYTNASYNASDYIIIEGLPNVAISGTETASGQYYYSLYDSDKNFIKGGGYADGGYIPIPTNAYYLRFDYLATATSVMVNVGTSPQPYTPYFSGLKHANFKGIKSTGKNLMPFPYDINTYTRRGLTFTANADGSVTVKGTATSSGDTDFIILPKGIALCAGTYTLSGAGGTNAHIVVRKNSSNWLTSSMSNPVRTATFNDGDVIDNVRIYFWASAGKEYNETVYPMLNFGNTAQPYEPYKAEEYTDGNAYELAEYDYISPQTGNIARQTGYATSETEFTEEEIASYNEPIVSVDKKSLEYKLENPIIEIVDYPKEYTAYNGGSETIEQGDTDNSEFGTICEITNEYWLVKEI